MTDEELDACFDLVEKTSGDDYRSSSVGWHPAAKKKEMRLPDLRYILVKDSIGQIRGFTSMMRPARVPSSAQVVGAWLKPYFLSRSVR